MRTPTEGTHASVLQVLLAKTAIKVRACVCVCVGRDGGGEGGAVWGRVSVTLRIRGFSQFFHSKKCTK